MELNELMNTSVEDLASKQHEKLKEHVLSVIKEVYVRVDNEKYDDIEPLTFSSPAGDGYGLDNKCINFDYGSTGQYIEGILDIIEVVHELKNIKQKSIK